MTPKTTAVALAALLALAACDSPAPGPEASVAPQGETSPSTDADAATAAAPAAPAPAPTATLVPEAERGETGARDVLLDWARGLERGDYAQAYAQFGQRGPNGASLAEFTDWWQRHFRTGSITVAVPTGEMEGAAGSLYYTAPATVTGTSPDGKAYRLKGDVILRRVNNVDGATPNQLRWHIESADLKAF